MAKETTPQTTVSPLLSVLIAEAFGTFVLVFAILGTAIFAGGVLTVALAAGFALLVAIYAFGHISGGHFNPAVTLGLALAGRFRWGRTWQYMLAQVLGGIVASSILFLIASGGANSFAQTATDNGFAANGFGELSLTGFSLLAVIVTEVVLTAVFVYAVLGATDVRATTLLSPLVIGLALTVVYLVAIPVSNGSVNPARSIAAAIYGGPEALGQLIVFILAPLLGAALAGLSYRVLFARDVA